MPRIWKWLAIVVAVLVVGIFVVECNSNVGRHADFRTNGVAEIEFSMGSMTPISRTTNANLCQDVLQSMRTGRATPPHACPALGSITVRYGDGTTNRVTISPAHRFGRIELRDATGHYSLSQAKLFGALKRAKLLPER